VSPEEEKIHNNVMKSKYDSFQKNSMGEMFQGFYPVNGIPPNMNKNVNGFNDQFMYNPKNMMSGNFGYF